MVVLKNVDDTFGWITYHEGTGATKYLTLHHTDPAVTSALPFNDTEPTTQLITLGDVSWLGGATDKYVAYIFCETDFCKPINYAGNGSTDGTFLNLGIAPVWSLRKPHNSSDNWSIQDIVRSSENPAEKVLYADHPTFESDASSFSTDYVSNGLKHCTGHQAVNYSGYNYLGVAIGRPTQATKAR